MISLMNPVIIVEGGSALLVLGSRILMAVASLTLVQILAKKVAAMIKINHLKYCSLCGNINLYDTTFWNELPQKSGKYKANIFCCYYKDMKWNGNRLEIFKRTGHDCPHYGEACTECGTLLGQPKAHKHPNDCPFK